MITPPHTTLHRYAIGTTVATFLLLIAGGLVTSTGSGLTVPDWPLSYGRFFPPMVGGILYEHGHRMIAGTIAVLTVILAFWLQRSSCPPRVRRLGWLALGAVIAQAVLGGVTVLLRLPPVVSVAHACLAQTFFCLVVAIAVMTSPMWARAGASRIDDVSGLRRLAPVTTGLIALQLVIGAVLRHTGAGVSLHVLVALLVAVLIMLLGVRIAMHHQEPPLLVRSMQGVAAALVAQLVLGGAALLFFLQTPAAAAPTRWSVILRTAHVAVGALLLAASLVLTLLVRRRCAPVAEVPTVSVMREVRA